MRMEISKYAKHCTYNGGIWFAMKSNCPDSADYLQTQLQRTQPVKSRLHI